MIEKLQNLGTHAASLAGMRMALAWLGLVVGMASAAAESRNPFIPRPPQAWPRKSPSPLPRAASATCGYGSTAFLATDRADSIARVELVTKRGSNAYDIKIVDQLKGTTGTTLYAYASGTCGQRLQIGSKVIVMTSRHGYLASGEAVLASTDPRAPTLVALLRATDDDTRAKLASDAVASTNELLSDEAQRYLLASPGVLAALRMRHKRALYLAAKRRPTRELALVLARIRLAIPAVIYDDLGLTGSVGEQIARVVDFEAETDPDALADVIKLETDPVRQFAAFERCDRLRKTTTTLDPARWLSDPIKRRFLTPTQLEAWCRGQTPTPTRPPYTRPLPPPPPRPPPPPPRKTSKCDPFAPGCGEPIPLKTMSSSELGCSPFDSPRAAGCTRATDTDLMPPTTVNKKKPAKPNPFARDLCPRGGCKTPKWKDPSPPRKRPRPGPFSDTLCDPFDRPGCGVPKHTPNGSPIAGPDDLEPPTPTAAPKCNPYSTRRACKKR